MNHYDGVHGNCDVVDRSQQKLRHNVLIFPKDEYKIKGVCCNLQRRKKTKLKVHFVQLYEEPSKIPKQTSISNGSKAPYINQDSAYTYACSKCKVIVSFCDPSNL